MPTVEPDNSASVAPLAPPTAPSAPSRGLPRGTIIMITLAAFTVAAFGVSSFRDIIGPVLLALILSICAHPVRVMLEKRGVPHSLATASVIIVVFGLLAGLIWLLAIAIAQFASMLPAYSTQLGEIAQTIGGWLAQFGFGQEQIQAVVTGLDPARILSVATGLLGSVFSITGALVIVLTMLIVMSADSTFVPTVLRQLTTTHHDFVAAIVAFSTNVRRYMVVATGIGAAQGALSALALVILDVPAALLWGLLVFLCSYIPNIGYFIAIIPPIVFGFLTGGWPIAIAVVIIYGIINSILQTIIAPLLIGKAVALSRTLTFFSVLFWAGILGALGAILAIPLTLLMRAILIDANPEAHMWRPAIGDLSETRTLLKAEDVAAKHARVARKHAKG